MRRFSIIVLLVLLAGSDDPVLDRIAATRDAGDISKAVVDIEAAIAEKPADRNRLLVAADLMYDVNRLTEARAAIERALGIEPPSAEWFALYGRILLALGDDAAAATPLRQALVLDPGQAAARTDLDEVEHLAAIRTPGAPPDSPPARVVDALIALARSRQLGYALLEHLDPAIFERLEALAGDSKGLTLRDLVALQIDDAFENQRSALGEVIGYQIGNPVVAGSTARVSLEIASAKKLTAVDVDALRNKIAVSSGRLVFGEGTLFDKLGAADRERYLTELIGRRELHLETVTFELREIRQRWMITDLQYTDDGGRSRSYVHELETTVAMHAGLARGLAEAMKDLEPRNGARWLDIATLIATLGVLGWLAVALFRK